jgi:hypothetical protein
MRFTVLLLLLAWQVFSQNAPSYLYVMHKEKAPAQRLSLGEKVAVKVAEEKDWIKGHLRLITPERIQVGKRTFYTNTITHFRTYNELLSLIGSAMAGGGLMFTGIFSVNAVINNNRPILTEGQVILGSGLLALGSGFIWLGRNTYAIEKGYYLKVIDLNITAND